MNRIGHIIFERGNPSTQSHVVRRCLRELKGGSSVFFFPEGTRTTTGRLRAFKKGAALVAKKAQVGMIPITVLGTGDIMPMGREFRLFPSPLGVKLIVHPVITAQEIQRLDEAQLTAQARAVIGSALPAALQEAHAH
jgi:1-acyl-sn-glycerol-3-phosphate acyltransferase